MAANMPKPHVPTLGVTIVILIVVLFVYHMAAHRKG